MRLLPLLLVVALLLPRGARSQVVEEPVLAGQVFLGDSVMSSGSVILHRLTSAAQGEIDSMGLAPDGTFLFALPSVPDEGAGEVYFASVRHDGVMYFGKPISRAVDLDSLYEIHAYDTLVVAGDSPAALESRSLFFEPSGSEWAVTDVFQLRNDHDRTLVPAEGSWVWSYPLPAGARDVAPVEGMASDVIGQRGDSITYLGVVQPGLSQALVVVRYFVDSLAVTIPTPGAVQAIDVLVREPAPAVAIEGLVQEQSIQMDQSGSTYRRFAGQGVELPEIRITMAEETAPPPVEWIAVVLALVLLGGGLLALRRGPRAAEAPASGGTAGGAAAPGREAILYEIARLDEDYAAEAPPSQARTREYKRRRAELMRRLKGLG